MRSLVAAVLGGSLLACFGGPPPPTEPIDDTAAPGRPDGGGYIDEPEIPGETPGRPRHPPRPPDRDDGDRRGKHGKKRPPGREPPPDTRPEPRPDPSPGPSPPGRRNGIEFVGDDTWRVDRANIDGWISDPSRLGASVSRGNGGYVLSGVREGSDAAALGARNGDLVKGVNGNPLATTADLLVIMNLLQSADDLRVELVRDAHDEVHRYQLVD